jgi:lysophospholipase L1-like esterase
MRTRGLIAVLVVIAASLTVVGATARPASAGPLASTPVITYNLQGAMSGKDSKWSTALAGYAEAAEIVAVQEAGPEPPGDLVGNIVWDPNAPGTSGLIQHHRWTPRRASYEVYFLQTDARGGSYTGGRTNMALITQREADEVGVVVNPSGRNVLGVRFGDNWYFTFHGQSNGPNVPNESADMAQRIAAFTNQVPGRQWTMLGDFNVEPRSFFAPARSYWYNSGLPTHINGSEYDYALSSENIPDHPVRRLPGRTADHWAVGVGTMRAAAEPPELRILPLGDSITYGANSTTGAYRGPLWDDLKNQTNTTVSYVGSQHYGSIPDNDNEGHPGWKIDDLANITDSVLDTYQPNVVLLHIGTNDMNENVDPAGAPGRLGGLIDKIFAKEPDVALLVSTLVPSTARDTEDRIFDFNNAIPAVVAQRLDAGKKVWLVDSWKALGNSDLADFLHPNDTGYRKMGDVFYQGIQAVEWAGWVDPPASPLPGGGTGAPVRGWSPQGVVASGTLAAGSYPGNLSVADFDQIHYADVSGDGKADLIFPHSSGSVDIWSNGDANTDGTVTWTDHRTFGTRPGVGWTWQFADFNGDGKAELIKFSDTEHLLYGYTSDGNPGNFGAYIIDWLPGTVRSFFADINGDGKPDWLQVNADSSVQALLNQDTAVCDPHSPAGCPLRSWGKPQTVATGVGVAGAKVRFADINGDGRTDYLVLNDDSSVQAFINGGPGGSGFLWYPQGTIATGVGSPGSHIEFADINGDHKADYLDIDPAHGDTRMWRNDGTVENGWVWSPQGSITTGSPQRIIYADINGDKSADYLQVNADSSVQAWLNGGPNPSGGDWRWYPQGTIAGGVGAAGANVRFADINGDNRADYLVVNANGSVQAWVNGGPNSHGGDMYWYAQGTIAGGVGEAGANIRFADINGDNKADYLVAQPNSAVRAWLNGGPNPTGGDYFWWSQGTIASGVGAAGRDVRFADLTGDRRADYLILHDTSAVDMWTNGGPNPSGGDWYWYSQGTTASGALVPGSRIQFADINADGREDYLDVNPTTGGTRAWMNVG